MGLMPTDVTCRTCWFYTSAADSYGLGVCACEASPMNLEWVAMTQSCREHDPRQEDGSVLVERECTRCEHRSLFVLGYDTPYWCTNPSCPDNQGGW